MPHACCLTRVVSVSGKEPAGAWILGLALCPMVWALLQSLQPAGALLCSTVYTLYEPRKCVAALNQADFVSAAPHSCPCIWDSALPVRVGDCKGCAMRLALGSVNICMKKRAPSAFLARVPQIDETEPIALAFFSTHITFGGTGATGNRPLVCRVIVTSVSTQLSCALAVYLA